MVASALVMLVFACGGGGCSGCAGCGISPIPGAFPVAQRIPNSAQVRLTSGGIDFIEGNITPIVETVLGAGLDFPVHRMTVSAGISVTICDDDHCSAHIDIESVDITPTPPNELVVHLRAILHSRHGGCVPGTAGCDLTTFTNGSWPGTCDIGLDTTAGARDYVGITATLRLRNITGHPARDGYTELVVESVDLTSGEDVETDDLDISGGFLGSCGLLNLGFIKNLIIGQLTGQISGLINGAIGDNLCTRVGTSGCPTGTFADGSPTDPMSICRYGAAHTDACVPMLLGMDGRGDLGGAFLGGFSPGTHAPIQLVLAAGGDGIAINNGMTVDLVGGFMSMDRTFTTSPGHNSCVPRIDPPTPFPPAIAQAAAFQGNVIPGTTTSAHLGIGIAEDYLNYAGYGMFDSGMLCIGTGTRISQQLSTGLLSALVRSLNSLTFPDTNASVAIAVRPQLPPTFDVGTDAGSPLLTITLPHAMIDFYVWSTERYIRFMTYQTDLVIEMNLEVMDGQIVPMISSITPTNSMVTNSELLSESPTALASTLETVIHSFAGMLTSGISPISLPAIMGFNLDIPAGGLVGINSSGDDFLSIWANLSLASPITASLDTHVEISDLVLSPESMQVEHWGETRNTAWLHFSSEGAAATDVVEYQYRVDQGPWSRWSRDQRVQIDDDVLLLQARHQIEARSRIVGQERSVDATPASASLLVDVLAPTVSLERSPSGMVATGDDIVSQGDLTYRFRIDDGEWSEWSTNDQIALDAETLARASVVVAVEARDEAGNVGTAQQALIRGIPNPAAAGGCGCRATGGDRGHGALGLALSMIALGLWASRRRVQSRKERV